ncbi:hypothetical protein U1Q18_036399 [Sarracenia purpurea var. burkii]
MAALEHVVITGVNVDKYNSRDEAVKEGVLLEENIASLTDSVGEQSAREGLDKVEEIKVETVKVGSPKDNFASPTDSEGATGREEPVSDSDEDGSDPEDSGSEEASSDGASPGSPGKGELKIGEIAGDSHENGSETCDGENQFRKLTRALQISFWILGPTLAHLSSSQSVECGWHLQSGVCKEPLGSTHHVFDFLPQGNAEGKGQVRAAVSSPRTWANSL